MVIKFDIERLMKDPALNDLTWEVIEARGIVCGDLVALWDVALGMAESSVETMLVGQDLALQALMEDNDPAIAHASATYNLLSQFLARDAREIVRFLKKRGFELPSESVE